MSKLLATTNDDVVDVPGRHLPRINVRLTNVEAEPNTHIRILVRGEIMRDVRPRAVFDVDIRRCSRLLPDNDPRRTIVDFDRIRHPRVIVGIEPAPEVEHDASRAARIDDGARQVIHPVHGRNGRITTDDDSREFVVERRRMVGGRIRIPAVLPGGSRSRTDLPFRTQRPAIPVGGRRIGERLFEYRHGPATRERAVGARHDAVGTWRWQSRSTRRATTRIAIVDGAVAIVVETVANLRRRLRRGYTLEHAILALVRPGTTNARHTRRAGSTTAGIVFVDRPIAVVIEAVANFVSRLLILIAYERAVHTHPGSRRAYAQIARCARRPSTRIVFVGLSVAIVVETIASFGLGQHVLIANDHAKRTGGRARCAHAEIARTAGLSAAGITFVDLTVAIVVFVIARLVGRLHGLNTNEPPILALVGPGRTYARQRRRAGSTALRVAFVDRTIAVIVDAVAAFGRGENRLRTCRRAVLAVEDTLRTRPELPWNGTCSTRPRISLVRRPIAIVVEAVADFRRTGRILCTNDPAIAAIRRTCRTDAQLPGIARHRPARLALVRLSVAIVVLVVARLGRGHHVRSADEHSSGAIRRSGRANARLPRHTCAAASGIAFISRPIAVVIDSVANLVRGRARHTRLHLPARARLHRDLTSANAAGDHPQTIVDEKIAIIIDTIAGFSFGLSRCARLRHTTDTRRHSGQTSAGTTGRITEVFVFLIVAIVIEIIAYFGRRKDLARTCAPGPAHARLHPAFAFAHIDRRRAPRITRARFAFGRARTIDTVVDLPIAIFVRPVARLGLRHARFTRRNRSADAPIDHHLTGPLATRLAWKTIIGLSIAIFVDAITRLGAR